MGLVLKGMKPNDSGIVGKKNDPIMPVAWTKSYTSESGKTGRVFTTTMGSSTDLATEGVRRLLVNAAYWCVGLEDKIPESTNVDLIGEFQPTPYGFGTYVKGKKPVDYAGQ
jgi:hypothetical protein